MAVLSGVLAAVGVPLPPRLRPSYLHQPPRPPRPSAHHAPGTGQRQDLEQLLQRFEQSYNLTPEDLGRLLLAAEGKP